MPAPIVKEILSKEIGSAVKTKGFRARGTLFFKAESFGKSALLVGLHKNSGVDKFDVTANVAIRFDEVENLVTPSNGLLTDEERKQTFTLGCELGTLFDGITRVWEDVTSNTASDVGASIVWLFEQYGLPFLDKYGSLAAALELLQDEQRGPLVAPVDNVRSMNIVAMTYILQGAASALVVARERRSALQERSDPFLARFDALLALLKERS